MTPPLKFGIRQIVDAGHTAVAKVLENLEAGYCQGNNMAARQVTFAVLDGLGIRYEEVKHPPKPERFGTHYDTIPHGPGSCNDPTRCDCDCSGCVKVRGGTCAEVDASPVEGDS